MTEAEARGIVASGVPRETMQAIEHYIDLLTAEAARQNLISASTLPEIWRRHVLDSVQLKALGASEDGWLDIGTGAGLPGLVVAIVSGESTTLVEPRALRATFLEKVVAELSLSKVRVVKAKVQNVIGKYHTISARAVAGIADLFAMAQHLAVPDTRWVLPRGRSYEREVAEARRSWHGTIDLVTSATDPMAAIVIASNVRARKPR